MELFTANGAVQVWKQNVTIFKMCMHSHFHPSPGYWFKMVAAWMYYRRPCNLPLRWRLPRTKRGGVRKGDHRPQAGNVKLWTIICWAKYNACQMNWSSTLRNPAAPPSKMLQRKVVCEYVCVRVCVSVHVCVQACCSVSISLFPPPPPSLPHPLTHMYTQTQMHDRITASPAVFFLSLKRKKRKRRKVRINWKNKSREWAAVPRLYYLK